MGIKNIDEMTRDELLDLIVKHDGERARNFFANATLDYLRVYARSLDGPSQLAQRMAW